jgi:hypothetical protein
MVLGRAAWLVGLVDRPKGIGVEEVGSLFQQREA